MKDLLDMPFNLVHELYRIVFIKVQLQIKQREEEKDKKEQEKTEGQTQAEREEALRSGEPNFVAKFKPYNPQTPPQEEKTPEQGETLAQQLINNDIENTLGGVFS